MADMERVDRETLYVEKYPSDRYAVVTLHRPDVLNAGSPALFGELADTIASFETDDQVRAIVLTGNGRAFSAGADLGGMTFDSMGDCRRFIRLAHAPFEAIERLGKIVIAAVNGYAFGFGTEIALACDLVLASEKARFGLREMNHGLVPAVTITRGVDMIGRRRVAWMAYTSDDISAEEARELGFVNRVVAPESLAQAYTELAVRMAKRAPLAVAATKWALNKQAGGHYREGENLMPAIFASADVAEGRRAFEERREPVFRGE
ncbi:enoyl-CoA hydratase-related protein [Acrocarpospora macrocephala]|uniref:Crotonase n=1 Tax=Acrocarpospora macrocephala TaxID=150177 RepID=A0A5M3WRJ1_9ACTN|nr:enoyl-CoA hydratase/isomerase family protein [Acrocarpospora macrocephala]GES11514.1 crotonase [Acrocarpospora macrocephala]